MYVTTNKLLYVFGYDSRIETKYYVYRNNNNSITFNNRLESCLCDKEKEENRSEKRINRQSNVYKRKEGERTSKSNKKLILTLNFIIGDDNIREEKIRRQTCN